MVGEFATKNLTPILKIVFYVASHISKLYKEKCAYFDAINIYLIKKWTIYLKSSHKAG